jgi:hypothetical protein
VRLITSANLGDASSVPASGSSTEFAKLEKGSQYSPLKSQFKTRQRHPKVSTEILDDKISKVHAERSAACWEKCDAEKIVEGLDFTNVKVNVIAASHFGGTDFAVVQIGRCDGTNHRNKAGWYAEIV